jgi:hypothetical protein
MALRRVHGPAAITAAAATKYTVPTGMKGTLRYVRYNNTSAGPVNFTLSIGADAAGTRLWDAVPVAAGDYIDWYPILSMVAAEIIQAFASVAQGVLTIDVDEDVA